MLKHLLLLCALFSTMLLSGCDTQEYSLSVKAKVGGTIAGAESEYILKEGTQVEVNAIPDSGYQFDRWSSDTGGSFEDEYSSETLFTMPGSNTVISASFKRAQESTLIITASDGGTIPAGNEERINGDYPEGARIEILARPMEGYFFTHWTSSAGGDFENAEESATYFIMPGNDTVVTAHFSALEP